MGLFDIGLFGFGKKKEFDIDRSDNNKKIMRELFNGVVEDGDSYDLIYGSSESVKTSSYIIARKTTYEFTSLIIGYRESDMSIVLVQTTPELEGCSEAEYFTKDSIKKAKMTMGFYTIFLEGGIMAGYVQFTTGIENDEKYLAYVYQPEEYKKFDDFFKRFSKK